jgi:hypothetical protein
MARFEQCPVTDPVMRRRPARGPAGTQPWERCGYPNLLHVEHPNLSGKGLQTVASRVHFREQYRALVGHALVWARVLLLLRALSVPGDTV